MKKKGGGLFVSMILEKMRFAEFCYTKGDLLGAIRNLTDTAVLVGAKLPPKPLVRAGIIINGGRDWSKLYFYFNNNSGVVAQAVKDYILKHGEHMMTFDERDEPRSDE